MSGDLGDFLAEAGDRRRIRAMSNRARWYVLLATALPVGAIYGRLSLEWSLLEFYGGMAGILLVFAFLGMPWVESAPDGAFRRRPQS